VLISLIRRNEWSIDELPVVEITRQFLAYIKTAGKIDPELGAEFIETASWLVLLKSRSMLPVDDADAPLPQEELRRQSLTTPLSQQRLGCYAIDMTATSTPGARDLLPAGVTLSFHAPRRMGPRWTTCFKQLCRRSRRHALPRPQPR